MNNQNIAWMSQILDENRVRCTACYHLCTLRNGEFGKCNVRFSQNNQLYSTVYGVVSSINIDPIEKKPMYHFLPSTNILSFGTVGCNFSCNFCQNFEISQYPKQHANKVFGKKLLPANIVELAIQYNVESVAYTYNEPAVFFEFAHDTAMLANEKGIKNIFVTSGYETTKSLHKIERFLDGVNIDLKSFSDNFYKKICGARLKPVLKCIEDCVKLGIWTEITTLIIEDMNDSDSEIASIAKYIASIDKNIPLHLSAFFPKYNMNNHKPTNKQTLVRAHEIAISEGLRYVYLGNFDDSKYLNTYCPKCGIEVIKRSGRLGENSISTLDNGFCEVCGYKIHGVWK